MATATSSPTSLPVRPMEVLVKGKVTHTRRHEKKFYTTITIPAADEYSSPQLVEVRSSSRVGDVDELVSIRARLGGYAGRPFKATDRETGEIRTVRQVQHTVDLVE